MSRAYGPHRPEDHKDTIEVTFFDSRGRAIGRETRPLSPEVIRQRAQMNHLAWLRGQGKIA